VQPKRVILVGAGGWAGAWVRQFIPAFSDRLQIAAIVDSNPEPLNKSADLLDIPTERRFTAMEDAFASVEADCCFLVIPPAPRPGAVKLAVERGLPILCEKPISDSWEAALAIYRMTQEAGVKLSVVQNYRYTTRIRTLKGVLTSGELGRVNYIVCRFAADFTIETAGGAFRHQIPDAMIYEGAEHHLDMFRNLADADVAWVAGTQWNQPWSTFSSNCCAAFLLEMSNGIVGQYEMTHITRGHETTWHHEYYRVECEHGAAVIDADDVVRVIRRTADGMEHVTEVAPDEREFEGHFAVIDEFLNWLDGGPMPLTEATDNMRTAALTFAAVEASRTRRVVEVPGMLTAAGI
jgi:predicted dehydrogenase